VIPARIVAGLVLLSASAACVPAGPDPTTPTPTGTVAAPKPGTVTYACDAGRTLAVTYGRENDEDVITINPTGEGNETLISVPVAQGLQYLWPSDGSYHIWTLKGGIGTLSYRDGEAGTTTPVLTNCRA
jgi:membrane-bound inhibitor of C-type lysozyme